MLFDPEESVDFQGNTGPFIQYTYARIQSILRKADFDFGQEVSPGSLAELHPKEKQLLKDLEAFPAIVEEAAAQHSRKVCNIIRTLGTVINIKNIQAVEESLLEVARTINKRKKGILQRLKKSSTPHHTAILSAAIATMGKIGTANSEAFLKKIAGAKTAQAEAARKAIEEIRLRYAKHTAGASANP